MSRLTLWGVEGIDEVRPGDRLGELVASACQGPPNGPLADADVLVVTQKVVSKAEGRLVAVDPDDPRSHKGLVEEEAVRVLRRRGDLVITETHHGFVCANSGVDLSNVERGQAALLPLDSDRSARRIRDIIRARLGVRVGVIVSDTFGRTWRQGLTDVAIGVAGVAGVVDLRGTPDALGRTMQVTEVAVADELAAAGELVMGKASGIPVAVIRGLDPSWLREASVAELIRDPRDDLFR
jgi:coenzyme F420-0:L-glutamate ligase/coenzyme F420-1:gamma-L-glutamate ligase